MLRTYHAFKERVTFIHPYKQPFWQWQSAEFALACTREISDLRVMFSTNGLLCLKGCLHLIIIRFE